MITPKFFNKNFGGGNIRSHKIYKHIIKALIIVFLFSIVFIVLSAVSAASPIIYVNGSGGNDSWDGQSLIYNGTSGPKKSIKNATGTVTNGGMVDIANGLYTGAGNTNIVINKNMTITGQSKTGTVINGTNTQSIFAISQGVNVIIQNLTIVNGNGGNGGAIDTEGNLTVINCIFTCNKASNCGGAIGSIGIRSPVSLTINGCTFTGNSASIDGGAICSDSILSITNSIFMGNIAYNNGGVISNDGTLDVTYSYFISNYARLGSVICSRGSANAKNNWWGSNLGPSSGMISGSVNYTPWLIKKAPPKVISTYPKKNAKNVSRTKSICIKFSDKIKASINWSNIYVKNKHGKIKISKFISGNILYIKTKKRSKYSYYTVYIPLSSVKDYVGNKLAKKYTFEFKTGK